MADGEHPRRPVPAAGACGREVEARLLVQGSHRAEGLVPAEADGNRRRHGLQHRAPPRGGPRASALARRLLDSGRARSAGVGAEWLFVPVGLVVGLILLVPTVLVVRGWRRRVQADRAYEAVSDRLPFA